MKLFIASDHAGFDLKESLKTSLSNIEWNDLGCDSIESVNYPDYAHKLSKEVLNQLKELVVF